MKRLTRIRWYSTEIPSPTPGTVLLDEKIVKPFAVIEKEMAEKAKEYHQALHTKKPNPSISKIQLGYQKMKDQFALGDAIMIGSLVYAVVKMPTNFQDPIIVCDAKGVTKQVWPAMVTARLGNLIPSDSKILQDCLNNDCTAVSGSVYQHFGLALGTLQNDALAAARELVPKVVKIILLIQKDTPVTTSLYDFLSLVQRLKDQDLTNFSTIDLPLQIDEFTPNFTPEFILAMQMVFDDYMVRNKVRLEFGYTKKNVLVVNSFQDEKLYVDIINKNTTKPRETKVPEMFVQYVKDYALDNLSTTNPQSEGIAVQILRSIPTYKDAHITKNIAFEWANKYGFLNQEGPFLDRHAYHWFTRASTQNDQLSRIASEAKDKLAQMRVDVEEPVWCIDSDDTTEVDDGISITTDGDIAKVQVHIANPTSAFRDPAPLLSAVHARSTTIYMPQGKISMLPDEFARNYSLANGSRALSIVMEFNIKTGERISSKIQASTLKNVRRVNYQQIETALEIADPGGDIFGLYQLSEIFYQNRLNKGAVVNLLVQNSPKVFYDGQDTRLETEKTPKATQLVTELMLQANSAVADFCYDNKVPCIYRFNSLAFYTEAQREEFFNQKVVGFEWMPAMRPSVQSTDPEPHNTTGLKTYTWFTSPLRRAQDLILHFQLEAWLLGSEYPLSTAHLENMIPWITTSQALTKVFQRQNDRYYILKYLEKHSEKQVTGYLAYTDRDSNIQTVYLKELGIFAEVHNAKPLGPGPHEFRIHAVDAISDLLTVRRFGPKL